GYMIWKDIEERWNKGRHGPAYDDVKDADRRMDWDTKEMAGMKKMFEVRNTMDDYTFLDTFFTPDLIERQQFYTFKLDERDNWYKINDRDPEKIRRNIMEPLINCSEPVIEVINGNFNNARELLLYHKSYDGTILEENKRDRTIRNIFKVWGRTVHLVTVKGGTPKMIIFDGDKIVEREIRQNGK
ncbi:MAG: SpoVR family protein, partial [Candidatus Woesearchaeota archaeon]